MMNCDGVAELLESHLLPNSVSIMTFIEMSVTVLTHNKADK